MRLFIAVPLPTPIARAAAALLPAELPGLRQVRAELLHLTLAFLGQLPDDQLDVVADAARAAAGSRAAFPAEIDRAGRFPDTGRPRVVWLGLGKGATDVERLGARVRAELERRAITHDVKPTRPHLTLARVREETTLAEARAIAAAVERMRVPRLAFDVAEVVVVESVLSPKGPRYTPRASVNLVGET